MSRWRWFGLLLLGVAVTAVVMVWNAFHGPNRFGEPVRTFTVSRGQTFAEIVDGLESQGIIRSRPLFIFVARVLGGTTKIQVGRYSFPDGISNNDLLDALKGGKGTVLIQVTLPEGLRARRQAGILARALGIDSTRFMLLVDSDSVASAWNIPAGSVDGYLLPETYTFRWQPDEAVVVEALLGEFRRFYTDTLQERTRELGWGLSQLMAMASIVEGEAMLDAERARISGVYHNRLRKGMPLQADPTVQFFIEGGPRRVLYSDLRTDHPYNTYKNRGLPPGPVNNPGKASILAALYPERHDYLYFVANSGGGHWFTRTYAEHRRYVREYRRLRNAAAAGSENTKGPSSR